MAFEDLKKADSAITQKDCRISKPELQLATLESARDTRELELKKKLEEEMIRADIAVKEAGDLKSELARVKGQLLE